MEIKCPSCGRKNIKYIETHDRRIDWRRKEGKQIDTYSCPLCHINFITSTKFKMEVTEVNTEWIYDYNWGEDED